MKRNSHWSENGKSKYQQIEALMFVREQSSKIVHCSWGIVLSLKSTTSEMFLTMKAKVYNTNWTSLVLTETSWPTKHTETNSLLEICRLLSDNNGSTPALYGTKYTDKMRTNVYWEFRTSQNTDTNPLNLKSIDLKKRAYTQKYWKKPVNSALST